jgi:hypothetical protein
LSQDVVDFFSRAGAFQDLLTLSKADNVLQHGCNLRKLIELAPIHIYSEPSVEILNRETDRAIGVIESK